MSKKNTKSKKRVKAIIFTVILSIIVIGVFAYLIYTGGNLLPKKEAAVAIVNGETITEKEFNEELSKIPEQYKLFIQEKDVLNQLIEKRLLLQQAKSEGITVTDAELESQISTIKKNFVDDAAFQKAMKDQNITLAMLKTELKDQMTLSRLFNQTVFDKIEVTDKDITEYYDSNKNEFKTGKDQVRLAYLLTDTKEEADKLSREIKKDTDLMTLADEKTVFYNSGILSKDSGLTDIEDAAFKLKVGEISDIIKTDNGYLILKRLPDIVSLNEARETIRVTLLKEKQDAAMASYIEDLKNKANIQIIEKQAPKENSFKETNDELCIQEGKPVALMLTSTDCKTCKDMAAVFSSAMKDYNVTVKEIELDSGDNLATAEKEEKINQADFEIIKKYDGSGAVPAYILGCRYIRTGNAYQDFNPLLEEQSLRNAMDKLVNNG